MEGTDKVLAMRRIDAGLAADGAVDLGEQAGGDLHEVHAAQQDRRREAGQVADHTTAQRYHHGGPLAARGDHGVQHLRQVRDILAAFACGNDRVIAADAGGFELRFERLEVKRGDDAVADDVDPRLVQHGFDQLGRARDQSAADMNVVAALAELDGELARDRGVIGFGSGGSRYGHGLKNSRTLQGGAGTLPAVFGCAQAR